MVEKVRLSGDPMEAFGLTQNPFAPKVSQPTRPITIEDIQDCLKTFIAVVGNYTLESSIQKARERAIQTLHIKGFNRLKQKQRYSKLTPQEETEITEYERRINKLIKENPEWLAEALKRNIAIGGRDAYYIRDWEKTYEATAKLCKALKIPMPERPYLDSQDLDKLSKEVCQTLKIDAWFKPSWTASKALCWLIYNEVYHYYKAMPQEQVTQELNEAIKEFDHAIGSLKISLDWE